MKIRAEIKITTIIAELMMEDEAGLKQPGTKVSLATNRIYFQPDDT